MSPETALAACRFVHDASAVLLWGAFSYLAFVVPSELARSVGQQLSVARVAGILLAVVTLFAALPIETATIGDGWSDAINPAAVWTALLDTSVGWAWVLQLAAAVVLLATVQLPLHMRTPATAVASALLLATLATQGHAVMQEGWLNLAHQMNDSVHVLAAGAWLGSLVPLLFVFRAFENERMRSQAGVALRRFSALGHVAVALAVVTGVINTSLTLGRWPTDWSSRYEALLVAKVGVVGVMIFVAIVNRYVMVPQLQRRRVAALNALRIATVGEVVLGLVAVALVGVFGLLDPA